MSTPLSYCQLVKAIDGGKRHRKNFISTMAENLKGGHFTSSGCAHTPPCREVTDEEYQSLENEITDFMVQAKP